MIEWSKLTQYQNSKYRSFEELCYQMAKGIYGNMGKFTSIDDSGGGDGVEFYLTLPNGDQWGWQAKFYYPNLRLSVSNRKKTIRDSLITSCKKHKHLTKWILCTPTNFTERETKWFEETLPRSIPKRKKVELEHWGDSDFNTWIAESRFIGKRHHFFGELELTIEWFRTQVEKQMAGLRDKFNPRLHTKTTVDHRIHNILCDAVFGKSFAEQLINIEERFREFKQALSDLSDPKYPQLYWETQRLHLYSVAKPIESSLSDIVDQLRQVKSLLNQRQLEELRMLKWTELLDQFAETYRVYSEVAYSANISELPFSGDETQKEFILHRVNETIHRPRWMADNLHDSLHEVVAQLSHINDADLHVFGGAGLGKTHLVSHICYERLNSGVPALLVLGSKFTSDRPLEQQLKEIFDVPQTYSWSDVLQALDSAAQAYRTRVPIVIDGLNEATRNGVFSYVWRLGLSGLMKEISQSPNVVLITTCRTSYKNAIWANHDPQNTIYTYGFDAYDVENAVEKYFSWYKIKADLTSTPLSQFRSPIFLTIFCESQNPSRQEEKHIYIGEHTLYEVFEQYLKRCNQSICNRLGLCSSANVLGRALNKIAQYLWEKHARDIPLRELVEMIDGRPIDKVQFELTKTKAILDEGLLVQREWYEEEEVVRFTYDLLGGYLIANHLLEKAKKALKAQLQSKRTVNALFSNDYHNLHPLHDVIGRCLAILAPVKSGRYLHELLNNKEAFSYSITALFELSPALITRECKEIISKLFKYPQNRQPLLNLASSTIANVGHPLNAHFWSGLLAALPMSDRDISWTEYIRKNAEHIDKTVGKFEEACKSSALLTEKTNLRLSLVAEYVKWVLTSTVRPLRDKATRALYWFGRRFPEQLLKMTENSLGINDPYIPERMTAASYGISMALQSDKSFANNTLQVFARRLFENIFAKGAPFSTTHILTRDYAKHTIDIAFLHHGKLLNSRERKRLTPPFKDDGIRTWGKSEDRNKDEYRDGNYPFGFDFNNYTMGYLLPKRQNYDFDDPEYLKVKANMWWRIYGLGYSLEKFGEVDKEIARDSFHRYGRKANGGKTDRYGKKYCWIAYYEIAGFRQDKGLLKREWESNDHKRFTVDIDPSFPDETQNVEVVRTDFLKSRLKSLPEWIAKGPTPDITPYLILNKIQNEQGPWVLIDGFIEQGDLDSKRDIFIFPRSLFVKKKDFSDVVRRLRKQDLGGRWLPEVPEVYYVFAGEVPWCETFPYNGNMELSLAVGIEKKRVPFEETAFLKADRRLTGDELKELFEVIDDYRNKQISEETANSFIAKNEIQIRKVKRFKTEIVRKTKEYEIIIPISTLNLAYHESAANPGGHAYVLSKELCEMLNLTSRPQTFDFCDKNNRRASITLRWGDEWHTFHKLIYIRKDLLDSILQDKKLDLIWGIWGERRYKAKENEGLHEFAKKHKAYKVFQEVLTYNQIAGKSFRKRG